MAPTEDDVGGRRDRSRQIDVGAGRVAADRSACCATTPMLPLESRIALVGFDQQIDGSDPHRSPRQCSRTTTSRLPAVRVESRRRSASVLDLVAVTTEDELPDTIARRDRVSTYKIVQTIGRRRRISWSSRPQCPDRFADAAIVAREVIVDYEPDVSRTTCASSARRSDVGQRRQIRRRSLAHAVS